MRICSSPAFMLPSPESFLLLTLPRETQLWRFYLTLPTPLSVEFASQRKKQKEYLAVRHELNATSSQDQFAKWAKLRRQHDKLLEQLEKRSMSPSFFTSIRFGMCVSASAADKIPCR